MYYFLTFGGGDIDYLNGVKELTEQAETLNIFYKIIGLTDIDLKNDNEFWNKHGTFILENIRGYGYWIWKPYIIKKYINLIEENDTLLYLDCGCKFNNITYKDKLIELLKMEKNDILINLCGSNDCTYTKKDVSKSFNLSIDLLKKPHGQAGVVFYKKTTKIIEFVDQWYELCQNYHNIDDSPSIIENFDGFIEHRHDQSIFNLLIKKNGLYDNNFFEQGINFPIIIKRIKYPDNCINCRKKDIIHNKTKLCDECKTQIFCKKCIKCNERMIVFKKKKLCNECYQT